MGPLGEGGRVAASGYGSAPIEWRGPGCGRLWRFCLTCIDTNEFDLAHRDLSLTMLFRAAGKPDGGAYALRRPQGRHCRPDNKIFLITNDAFWNGLDQGLALSCIHTAGLGWRAGPSAA